jgi:hypothetical protein
MVAYSGTTVCTDRLRPLNRPRPIHVETDDRGYPVAVGFSGSLDVQVSRSSKVPVGRGLVPRRQSAVRASVEVAEILDRWRIDDEWWRPALQGDETIGRAEISRMYYHVSLRNRQLIVIFRDLIDGGWYAQTNATPLSQPEPVEILTPRTPAASSPSARLASIRRIAGS